MKNQEKNWPSTYVSSFLGIAIALGVLFCVINIAIGKSWMETVVFVIGIIVAKLVNKLKL